MTENYLEIHLFWAGKATCCVPKQGYYGPLIAAVHVVADFTLPRGGRNKTRLVVCITVPVVVVGLLLLLLILYLRRKSDNEDEQELLGIGPQPNTFSYAKLKAVTEDFNPSNKLGGGSFGKVYKGTLF